jgi:hypothetical protein
MENRPPYATKLAIITLIFAALALSVPDASADTFTFQGQTSAGNSVDATATLTHTNGSNVLAITLTNNLTDIVTVGQGISGLSFEVTDSAGNIVPISPVTITSQMGREIDFAGGNKTAVDLGSNGSGLDPMGWGLSTQNPAYLNAIGFAGAGSNPPDEVILGAPTTGLTYSSANGSITNSPSHQPFVDQTAFFTVTLGTNWQDTYHLSNVSMFFGTGPDTFSTVSSVPEPGTLVLLGTGLAGVAVWSRKRKASPQV